MLCYFAYTGKMNVLSLILVFICLTLTATGGGEYVYFGGTLIHSKYLYIAFLGSDLTVTPENSTQPSSQLTIFSSLTCVISANFPLSTASVESRWILSNGTTIINDGRYSVTEGSKGSGGYVTILLIRPTIYSDENTYTCEVRDIRDSENLGPWLSFQATLQLLGKHLNVECHSTRN